MSSVVGGRCSRQTPRIVPTLLERQQRRSRFENFDLKRLEPASARKLQMSAVYDVMTASRVIFYSHLKRHPRIFLPLARWRENYKRRAVRPETDIVIEGYTRSGNHPCSLRFSWRKDGPWTSPTTSMHLPR